MPRTIDRSAFIYMDPINSNPAFAQCATCRFWEPQIKRCALFVPNQTVVAESTCGLYVYGQPSNTQVTTSTVYPSDAGFETRPVRCQNCAHFYPPNQGCSLFKQLNEQLPLVFNLDIKVHPLGCCNANTPKD